MNGRRATTDRLTCRGRGRELVSSSRGLLAACKGWWPGSELLPCAVFVVPAYPAGGSGVMDCGVGGMQGGRAGTLSLLW